MTTLSMVKLTATDNSLCYINPAHVVSIYISSDEPNEYQIEMLADVGFSVKLDSPSGEVVRKLLKLADSTKQIEATS